MCPKAFPRSEDLRVHVKTHTGEYLVVFLMTLFIFIGVLISYIYENGVARKYIDILIFCIVHSFA